ncbi:MAG: hypothetical protein IJV04_07355 [Lachnospiraceae bacterium]|nr:hypothetical protein [Lachnospiraceae bacterium]
MRTTVPGQLHRGFAAGNRRARLLRQRRRLLAAALAFALVLSVLPVQTLHATAGSDDNDTTITLLLEVVKANISSMSMEGKAIIRDENQNNMVVIVSEDQATGEKLTIQDLVDDITELQVKAAFTEQQKKDNQKWGNVSIKKTIEKIASDRGGEWDSTKGNTYNSGEMGEDYTMGELVIEYVRKEVPDAAKVKNSAIKKVYNDLATDTGDPAARLTGLRSQVLILAGKGGFDGYPNLNYKSVLNNKGKVTFADYTIRNRIPSRTLFIGTYLIHMNALNNVTYRAAMDSVSKDNQQIMYYKSELDGGRWKDILGAGGIDDILPSTDLVDEDELDSLVISCVIGEDGFPKNPVNGADINLFEMTSPYRMNDIPELMPLRIQNGNFALNNNSDRFTDWMLKSFFKWDTPFDRERITESDIHTVLQMPKRNICFFNLRPSNWTWWHRSDADAFITDLQDWQFTATITNNLSYRLKPKVIATDHNVYGFGYWHSRIAAIGHNTLPIISGPIAWQGEREFWNEWGGKWDEFQQIIWDFIEWTGHMYTVEDEVTEKADKQLATLWPTYLSLRRSGNTKDADILMELMGKVDGTRRAEAYYNLVFNEHHNYDMGPTLVYFLDVVKKGKSNIGNNFKYWYGTETYAPVDAIVSSVEEAIPQCQARYNELRANSLSEGKTILSKAEYDWSMDVINNAERGNTSALSSRLADLSVLYNINDGVVENKTREIGMVDSFMGQASTEFATEVHNVAGERYTKAAADPETDKKTLKNYLLDQKALVSEKAVQLQDLITARALRLTTTQGVAFINQRLDWAKSQKSGIKKSDPFGQYAKEGLDEHIKWLEEILKNIQAGSLFPTDEEQEDAKEQLERNLLEALDNNNIEEADKAKEALENAGDTGSGNGTGDDGSGDSSDGSGDGEGVDGTDGGGGTTGGSTGNTGNTRGTGGTTGGETGGDTDGGTGGGGSNPPDPLKEMADEILGQIIEKLDNDDEEGAIGDIEALGELGYPKKVEQVAKAADARGSSPAVTQAIDRARIAADNSALQGRGEALEDNGGGTGGGTGGNTGGGTDGDGAGGDTRSGTGSGGTGGDTGTGTGTGDGRSGDDTGGDGTDADGDDDAFDGDGDDDGFDWNSDDGSNGDEQSAAGTDGNTGAGDNGNTASGSNGNSGAGTGTGNNTGTVRSSDRDRSDRDKDLDDLGTLGRRLTDAEIGRLNDLIESMFGAAFGDLPDDEKIAVIIGLSRYGIDYDNEGVLIYARTLLEEVVSEHNPFVYRKYAGDNSTDYVSLAAIDRARRYTQLRYVRNGNKASLTRFGGKANSFVFTIGGDTVRLVDGKNKKLSAECVQQADSYIRGSATKKYPYIGVEDSLELLGITCQYVPDADYAALATRAIDTRARSFYDRVSEIL